jgi:alkanesulfonate monooxygenase
MSHSQSPIEISSPIEVSWFGALCDDDYEQLGVPKAELASSWAHCADIATTVDRLGFDNILMPSGYDLGIDTISFASSIAPQIERMRMLTAVRVGENWVPQLARQLATLNQVLNGRLVINIISSEMPGETLDGPHRYRRTTETMRALRTLMNGERLEMDGEFISLHVDAPRICKATAPAPAFYFGGLSNEARETAAMDADVYLMWPDTEEQISLIISDMRDRAARHNRTIKFGYRVHVVVRETEEEARNAAAYLISAVDEATGDAIRAKSLDSTSIGVQRQAELRAAAHEDGFIEPSLWTGIGKARSGCGAAIVGTPQQVVEKIQRYQSMGIEAFIFSGYPHIDEAQRFAELVLPHLHHGPLGL